MQQVSPARPAIVARPVLTPVQANGPVVRITAATRTDQILNLRDDQTIETPSGRRINVGRFRRLQAMFAGARSRHAQRRAAEPALLPLPSQRGTPRGAGENAAQLLARPDSDVIRLRSGSSVSVAQLRVVARYLQQHGRMPAFQPVRPSLSGPATRIATVAELKSVPRDAPDSQVLESPKGTRVTVGELRKVLGAQHRRPRAIRMPKGAQQ